MMDLLGVTQTRCPIEYGHIHELGLAQCETDSLWKQMHVVVMNLRIVMLTFLVSSGSLHLVLTFLIGFDQTIIIFLRLLLPFFTKQAVECTRLHLWGFNDFQGPLPQHRALLIWLMCLQTHACTYCSTLNKTCCLYTLCHLNQKILPVS